ncbi:adaptin ear-binding coat-associated protein 1/2, partial [Tremellales sp. Uapishka_1]
MDSLTDDIESILFIAREVMVYQVPPRTSASGYKAADWNVEQFLWKGRLRVIEIGEKCELRLEVSPSFSLEGTQVDCRSTSGQDSNTGELFAQSSYGSPWTSVEPVLDSSRYFVLRVEGEGGKRAYIGMGFAERGEAFDFQVALQSIAKRSSTTPSTDPSESPKPAAPPKDYSLKEGQTFSIKIPGREGRKPPPQSVAGGGGGGGGLFALPPPPPGARRK